MLRDTKYLISQMTLEEKAGLCSGFDFWHTKSIERLGIPSIMMADGPHGLRKQAAQSGNIGLGKSEPATCFPTGVGLAASWDRQLMQQLGIALGQECQAEGVSIILGPAINIKRSPLCGRNFEYLSEDPYLVSELASCYINGVQSQGVGTSLKHYAANNQEHRRMTSNSEVDERALREMYLTNFERTVKKSQPWTVMCAYNKLNGEYCSQNKRLLTDILRGEWGFEGFVVSDWGAVDDRELGLAAGLELEMPSSQGAGDRRIVEAVKSGKLDENILDAAVERLLNIIFKAVDNKKSNTLIEKEAHHSLARQIAAQCMVLLKNEDNILPLEGKAVISVIGAFAKSPRYQGGGSSHINPFKLDSIYEEITNAAGKDASLLYAEGYKIESDEIEDSLIEAAKQVAMQSEVALIFAGLPDRYESEGYDRKHLCIPENQRILIEEVAKVQPNIVVVLSNGSPVEMPWLGNVKAVLEAYLGGQALGGAISDLLFGFANPCGKLAETFPAILNHNPSYLNFPGEGDQVEYKEGVFVGYRYYDAKQIEPLFPFGHGLSYTTFSYEDICLDKKEMYDAETLTVTVKVKNAGQRAGKEIVQLYVKNALSSVTRPCKELKGFEKIYLEPGQEKIVFFTLDKRSFAYYNIKLKDWHVETGKFEILIGKSSKEIILKDEVLVNSTTVLPKEYTKHSTIGDIMADPKGAQALNQMMAEFNKRMQIQEKSQDGMSNMMMAILRELPFKKLSSFSRGAVTEETIEAILQEINK